MIEVQALTKHFGPIVAVDDVSFAVGRGEVLGFLGPNGAGKSTTMKMITGFLAPTSGTAVVCGADILAEPIAAKRHIGYLPEGAPAYPDMTPKSFLRFIAAIRGFRGEEAQAPHRARGRAPVARGVLEQPIDTLSKGFKRRVGLAQALLHDPEVLILDEPTDGLDPNQKHEVRTLIRKIAAGEGDRHLDPSPRRGRCGLHPRHRHRRGRLVPTRRPRPLEARSRYHNAVAAHARGPSCEAASVAGGLPGVASVEALEREGAGTACCSSPRAGSRSSREVSRSGAHARGWPSRNCASSAAGSTRCSARSRRDAPER